MPRGRSDAPQAKPRNDAYTGMLAISLGAMIVGCVLLFVDYSSYPETKPKEPDGPVSAKQLVASEIKSQR